MSKQIKNKNTIWLGNNFKTKANYYGFGDTIQKMNESSINQFNKAFNKDNWASSVGSIGTGLLSFVNSGVNNAKVNDTSNIENAINTYTNMPIETASREALSNQWVNTAAPKTDYDVDDFRTSDGERIKNTFSSTLSGITTGASIGGPWGALIGGAVGLGSGIAGMISGNAKAAEKAKKINKLAEQAAINRQENNYAAADYLDEQDAFNFLSNYIYKNGGYMNDNLFSRGGYLGQTHGSIFSNNVSHINEGGSHSENKYGGVQNGVDEEGAPNLVEEGEVIYNDYVFSNRLYPTREQLAEYLLPDKYADHTFAWIANELSKESEERPNDEISIKGLEDSMNKLTQLHELIRQENKVKESNRFDRGGDLRKIYGINKKDYKEIYDLVLSLSKRRGILENSDEFYERLEEELLNKSAIYYAQNQSGARENSPRFNEIYKERFNILQDRRRERIASENRKKQADQFLKDRGYTGEINRHDSFWSYGTYNNKNHKISDEDYKIYQDIINGNNSYIDGNLGKSYTTNEIIEEGDFVEDQTTENDEEIVANQGGSGSGSGVKKSKSETTEDISKTAPDISKLQDYLIKEELGVKPINTPDNLIGKLEYNQKDPDIQRIEDNIRQRNLDNYWDARINNPEGNDFDYSTLLRYAAPFGNLLAYLGNNKDYSDVNSFMEQTASPRSVAFTPLGNYIRSEYISPWEMTNPIERQAAATRSALMNNAGNNRAAANAALIGSDYNTLGLLGQALLQGKQYNNQQRLQAADFNRGTDQYNSQGAMQAQSQNMNLNNYYLQRAMSEYNMRNTIDAAYNQARSANLTSFFNNLGNIGRENYIRNQVRDNRFIRYKDKGDGSSDYKG